MKFKLNICFIALLGMTLMFSCSEEAIDKSEITSFAPYSFEGLPSDVVEVQEESQTIDYTFTFNENQITDVHLIVSVDPASTATEGEDFTLSTHSIDVAALEGTGSFSVTINPDFVTEGDETFGVVLSSDNGHGLPLTKTIDFVIRDVVSKDLILTFDWDGVVVTTDHPDLGTGEYGVCSNGVDIDVYVLDAMGNDLGIYDAATGDCPEQIIVSDWADGEYFLASNMWDNPFFPFAPTNGVFEMKVNAFKQDVFDVDFLPTDNWTSDDEDQANSGNTDFIAVGKVTVAGDTFTVEAPDGTVVAQGFKAPHKVVSSK